MELRKRMYEYKEFRISNLAKYKKESNFEKLILVVIGNFLPVLENKISLPCWFEPPL
jgi:hypothetical protein